MLKDGKTAYEGYYQGYTAARAVHVYSVTKSVFSILIGIAIDKGYIRSVEQRVLDFFPDYTDAGDETAHKVTVKNLLTMTAPYKCGTEPYEALFASPNWMEYALDLLGGNGPTDEFRYSPIVGSHLLSGILTGATGQTVLDFATENLFAPLGIEPPDSVALHTKEEHIAFGSGAKPGGWAADPQGIHTAGWGLCLTPMDMAKIAARAGNDSTRIKQPATGHHAAEDDVCRAPNALSQRICADKSIHHLFGGLSPEDGLPDGICKVRE